MATRFQWMMAGAVLSALSVVGCASNPGQSSPLREVAKVSAVEGEWTLVAIDGHGIDTGESGVRRSPTLTLADDGAAAGFSGVNRFSGRLTIDGSGRASFGPVVSTKMAGPPGAMAVERAYFQAMSRIDRVKMGGTALVFLSGEDEALLYQRTEVK